ncbi:hypothetical protein ACWIB8_03470 [Corynebacterium flavescens]
MLAAAGSFALFGFTTISRVLLALATISLIAAVVYQPDEFTNKRTKPSKAVGCLGILCGALFIIFTGSWMGIIAICSGMLDLVSGQFSIFRSPASNEQNDAASQ